MAKTFLISDESVNSYGFRILSDGLDISDFKKNPIMLFNHKRPYGYDKDEILPIGKWTNLRKENGQWMADAEFDLNDEFAARIAAKVEGGFLNACSVGVSVVEMSEDAKMVKPGQTRPTVTKSKLVEISITDIPSNKNAVALYDADNNLVALSANGECTVPLLTSLSQTNILEMNVLDLTQIGLLLNLSEVTNETVIAKIKALQQEAAKVATLSAELGKLQEAENARLSEQKKELLKKVPADQVATFATLLDANFDATKAVIEKMPAQVSLTDFVQQSNQPGISNDGKIRHLGMTFAELSQKNSSALEKLKETNLPLFEALYESEYNKKYKHTVRG